MDIKSVAVTLDADDLRIMASALRIYHRGCIMSTDDERRLKNLVHLAERADQHQGECYADMMRRGDDKPAMAGAALGPASQFLAGDGGSAI